MPQISKARGFGLQLRAGIAAEHDAEHPVLQHGDPRPHSAIDDDDASMDVSLPPALFSEESYVGPPVSDFENTRGEGIRAFGHAVAVGSVSDKEGQHSEKNVQNGGDLQDMWSQAASSSGERPKDFGFLSEMFGGQTVAVGSVSDKAVAGSSISDKDLEFIIDEKDTHNSSDFEAMWSQAASSSGERPKDFGFLSSNGERSTDLSVFNKSFGSNHSHDRSPAVSSSPDRPRTKFDDWILSREAEEFSRELDASREEEFSRQSSGSRRRTRSSSHMSDEAVADNTKIRRTNSGKKVVHEAEEFRLDGAPPDEAIEEIARQQPQLSGISKADKTLMCKFFLGNGCRRTACNFAHSKAEQQEACAQIPCRYQIEGTCRASKRCWYKHTGAEPSAPQRTSLDGPVVDAAAINQFGKSPSRALGKISCPSESRGAIDKTVMCKFWMKNRCKRRECNFAHSEEERRAACGRLSCRLECQAEGCQDTDCPFGQEDSESRMPQSSDGMGPGEERVCSHELRMGGDRPNKLKPRVSSSASSDVATASSSTSSDLLGCTQDKTMLCTFFMKNRCQRSTSCKFAHGEDEQRAACKKIRCRFDKLGSCRQGSECWYMHREGPSTEQSTPKKAPASCSVSSATLTPNSIASSSPSLLPRRSHLESWADLSIESDDDMPIGSNVQGFTAFMTA